MFKKESQLVQAFADNLLSNSVVFPCSELAFEFDFRSGRTDIIGVSEGGELFAFEAKLERWKDALNQAYRNSAFAHSCYVVVPTDVAQSALKSEREFKRRGVGLCSVSHTGIEVLIPACHKDPLFPWLSESAKVYIDCYSDEQVS
jgi:hypothetical protein